MIDTAQVIESARDRCGAFDPARQPVSVALRYLQTMQMELLNDVIRVAPFLALEHEIVDLPLAVFDDGWPFPDSLHVRDGIVFGNPQQTDGSFTKLAQFKLVSSDRRLWPTYTPSGWLGQSTTITDPGQRLFLTGCANDWLNYLYIDVLYVPVPADPSLSVDLVLPIFGGPLAEARLALFFGGRAAGQPDVRAILPDLREEAASAQKVWIDSLVRAKKNVAYPQDDYGGWSGPGWGSPG